MRSRTLHKLYLVCLWLAVGCLIVVTSISLVATFVRSDCRPAPSRNVTAVTNESLGPCTVSEMVSNEVLRDSAYLQSVHTIALQFVFSASLLVFRPALQAFLWKSLEATKRAGPRLSLMSLHSGMQLSASPGLMAGITDAWSSRRITSKTATIIFLAAIGILSPVVISPIYRPKTGSLSVNDFKLLIGGGIGMEPPPTYAYGPYTSRGIVIGRALINSATVTNTSISSLSNSPAITAFLDRTQIRQIAHTTAQTAVTYQSIDCGPAAPLRFTDTPSDIVTLTPSFWNATTAEAVVYAGSIGTRVGLISNEPQVSAFYVNGTTDVSLGWVNSTSSVVFLAANGTLEGAQQRILAPTKASPRLTHVDVLACTATVNIGVSTCEIFNGHINTCTPTPPDELPAAALNDTEGGLGIYLTFPESISRVLTAAPVFAFESNPEFIPMYDTITPSDIATNRVPLSFLSFNVANPSYEIPQYYVRNGLFFETIAGLVQGMMETTWTQSNIQPVNLIVVYATRHPELQIILLFVAVTGAAIITSYTLYNRSSHAAELDVARLIAISRDSQLDYTFAPFADRNAEIPMDVQHLKVRYEYVPRIQRHAFQVGDVEAAREIEADKTSPVDYSEESGSERARSVVRASDEGDRDEGGRDEGGRVEAPVA